MNLGLQISSKRRWGAVKHKNSPAVQKLLVCVMRVCACVCVRVCVRVCVCVCVCVCVGTRHKVQIWKIDIECKRGRLATHAHSLRASSCPALGERELQNIRLYTVLIKFWPVLRACLFFCVAHVFDGTARMKKHKIIIIRQHKPYSDAHKRHQKAICINKSARK